MVPGAAADRAKFSLWYLAIFRRVKIAKGVARVDCRVRGSFVLDGCRQRGANMGAHFLE
jgi:hypothetical protein